MESHAQVIMNVTVLLAWCVQQLANVIQCITGIVLMCLVVGCQMDDVKIGKHMECIVQMEMKVYLGLIMFTILTHKSEGNINYTVYSRI